MKVNINLQIDLPEDFDDWTDAEIGQYVFDEFIQYLNQKHAEDVANWCFLGKVGTDEEDLTKKLIYEHHKLLTEILRTKTYTIDIVR